MKIAVAGKGGSGKTTIAGTLARILAARGHPVVAVDDDSNPNLGMTVGAGSQAVAAVPSLPRDLLEERVSAQGDRRLELTIPVEEILQRYGVPVAERLTLVVMGQPSHGGSG
jgi:CO dehydrogenase maturation factor